MANAVPVYETQTPPRRPEPPVDRFGRYRIPDPITGKDKLWTRVSTWAKSVADTFSLNQWAERQVALGLAMRGDLLLHVAALAALDQEDLENKKKLQDLCEQAKAYAKAKFGANVGSGLHGFTEALDSGRKVEYVPEPWDKDIAAYQQAMQAVEVSRNYIETIGTIHELGVAGKMDRLVRFKHGRLPMVGDLKTTGKIEFSWTEIAIQLALYAHFDTTFDPLTQEHRPMIKVDQERALVVHLPAGQARCQLFVVDIAAGWEMAQVCKTVRTWRSRKDLAQLLVEEKV